ncbi:hypothetical protein AB0H43_03060 [Hamadaea sp. NPDC050747]|uniref:hypothetical protein n=1 Tax=Hamadaea sp. NPDC050747 TaxID=3155789 RepID=UPI0034061F85
MTKSPISRAAIVAGVSVIVWALARFGVAVPPEIADNLTEVLAVAAPLVYAFWESRHQKAARAKADTPVTEAAPRPADEADTPADQAEGVEASARGGSAPPA